MFRMFNLFFLVGFTVIACQVAARPASTANYTTSSTTGSSLVSMLQLRWNQKVVDDATFSCPGSPSRSFTCGLSYCDVNPGLDVTAVVDFNFNSQGLSYNFASYMKRKSNSYEERACTNSENKNEGFAIDELSEKVFHGFVKVKEGSTGKSLFIPFKSERLKLLSDQRADGKVRFKYRLFIEEDSGNLESHKRYNRNLEIAEWVAVKGSLINTLNKDTDERIKSDNRASLKRSELTLTLTPSSKYQRATYTARLKGHLRLPWPNFDDGIGAKVIYTTGVDIRFGSGNFRKDLQYLDSISFVPKQESTSTAIKFWEKGQFTAEEIIIIPH